MVSRIIDWLVFTGFQGCCLVGFQFLKGTPLLNPWEVFVAMFDWLSFGPAKPKVLLNLYIIYILYLFVNHFLFRNGNHQSSGLKGESINYCKEWCLRLILYAWPPKGEWHVTGAPSS